MISLPKLKATSNYQILKQFTSSTEDSLQHAFTLMIAFGKDNVRNTSKHEKTSIESYENLHNFLLAFVKRRKTEENKIVIRLCDVYIEESGSLLYFPLLVLISVKLT